MQSIQQVMNNNIKALNTNTEYIPIVLNKSLNTTGMKSINNLKVYENDQLFDQLPDLVNETFRPWYMKCFYKLGKIKVMQLASIARQDGDCPPKLFSRLLIDAV